MSGSSVHEAITALYALATTTLPHLQVEDGPIYDPRTAHLAVGWHSNDEPAAAPIHEVADMAMSRDQEAYDIACLLSGHVGKSGSTATVRGSLYTDLNTLATALAADRKLGGAVANARIGEAAYFPTDSEGGSTVSVRFSVRVITWK